MVGEQLNQEFQRLSRNFDQVARSQWDWYFHHSVLMAQPQVNTPDPLKDGPGLAGRCGRPPPDRPSGAAL